MVDPYSVELREDLGQLALEDGAALPVGRGFGGRESDPPAERQPIVGCQPDVAADILRVHHQASPWDQVLGSVVA